MSEYLWLPESAQEETLRARDQYSVSRSFSNRITGAGGKDDVVANTRLKHAKFLDRGLLETLYIESWSAGKVVDLIVDDIFAPDVIWNEEGSNKEKMIEHLDEMGMWENLSNAARAGRLYGTALLIACPSNASQFEEPLKLEATKAGDIANLAVVDRHSLTVKEVYDDPSVPQFGLPYMYEWTYQSANTGDKPPPNPAYDNGIRQVHESRCFRFDGVRALGREGWMDVGHERWWGFSILQRVLEELLQDMVMSSAGADVVQRTGMPVIKVNRFRESQSKGVSGPGPSLQGYANNVASGMNFRSVLFLDKQDDYGQIQINSSGVRDLLDSQVERLAMIAGVPITRFTGASAMGLNATGNGDAREWRTTVEAYRKKNIEPHMKKLMLLMARNAGLSAVPDWEWGRLGEMTLQEQVDALKGITDALSKATGGRPFFSEPEVRTIASAMHPNINVPPDDFEPPEDELKERVDNMKKVGYNGAGNENQR